jgi:hypothetical protein
MLGILTVVVTLIILVWQLLVANHKVRLASFTSMESRQQTQACRLSPSFFFSPSTLLILSFIFLSASNTTTHLLFAFYFPPHSFDTFFS